MGVLPTDKLISCFYESAEDCVKVIDTNAMLLSFNPNGYKVMEIDDPKMAIGKSWINFWKGDMQPLALAALDKAKRGEIAKFEGLCETFKGNMRYWHVMIAPLFDDYGQIQWLLVSSRDATEERNLRDINQQQAKEIASLKAQLAAA
jgi:PAS domain-containing protein